jgi:hypothetical protein
MTAARQKQFNHSWLPYSDMQMAQEIMVGKSQQNSWKTIT